MTRVASVQAASTKAGQSPGPTFLLQRACACGTKTPGLTDECEECAIDRMVGLQPKLVVGAPGDRDEREAEDVADAVVRDVGGRGGPPAPMSLGRSSATRSANAAAVPRIVARTLGVRGRALDPAVRGPLERRFGRRFDEVRVHDDSEASRSARVLGARAYTHGTEIVFAAGEYRPDTRSGLRLLAHELAHVVQQAGDPGAPVQRDLAIEPQGINKTERKLSEKDITDAIAFNAAQIKNKQTLREIRDVVGVNPDPAVSDRDLALAVARWQASHGVAQDGKLGQVTVLLLVEELQAEGELVTGLGTSAEELKKAFSKGTFLDVDAGHCGCKAELEREIKSADAMIGHYTACGADPNNKTGDDIEACRKKRVPKGKTLGTTSSTGAITVDCKRTGPCAKLLCTIDLGHEQIHSVHTRELRQTHGAGTAAFSAAYTNASDWVADEINARNTDKSLSNWALRVLQRICP